MCYTYGALRALVPYCVDSREREELKDYLDSISRTGISCMSKTVYGVNCPYYWTYGRMRDYDREYVMKAFEEQNYSKWYNCKLLYPDCLPEYFNLTITDLSGQIAVEAKISVNYLTFPYFYEDGENG